MKIHRRTFLKSTGAGVCASMAPPSLMAQNAALADWIWPQGQALPWFREPRHLDAADIQSLPADAQLLLTTLQGVVNRRIGPSLYWFQSGDKTDQTWLETLAVPNTITSDPLSLVARYRKHVQGAIVYDPNLADTINVATSLAGVREAVVATAELAAAHKLRVVADLRGRFKTKFEAYRWLIDNYWDRLNHRLLTGISPANPSPKEGVSWKTLLQVEQPVTDGSNQQVYKADLTALLGGDAVYLRYQDAYPGDGWGPSVSNVTVIADGKTIASFQPGSDAEQPFLYEADSSSLGAAWRFADGNSYFIYRFVPPAGTKSLRLETEMWNEYLVTGTNQQPIEYQPFANFRDYIVATRALVFWLDPLVEAEAALFRKIVGKVAGNTPYLGWFPGGHEDSGVTLCGKSGVTVVAADFLNNATVFAGARAEPQPTQPVVATPALGKKVYVTLTMSEGDNLQYNQHRMRDIWDDTNRGKVPINWSISPLLVDAGPVMLDYFQRTQTPNDFFVAGPSGIAYTYPGLWPANDLALYTRQTGKYLSRTGMNVIYALNRVNDTNVDLTDAVAAQYERDVKLLGVLSNWIDVSRLSKPSGLLTYTQVGISSVTDGQDALSKATAGWDGKSPLFVAIGVLAWNMTPTDVNTLVASLGSQYEVVRADTFFELLRRSHA